jgi:predicted dehydrogenase/threonine dehydrogenase-like Zn-dependent dehydrogenase
VQQVIHDIQGGRTRVVDVPVPIAAPGTVVVATGASVISAGTERYVLQLAQSSLLSKARQRPDHVRRILQKLREQGLVQTATQVRAKLQEPLALGYSAAGTVLACGRGVHDLKVGERVAVAGAHAAAIAVGRNLCARLPDDVDFEQGAYAPLGAIALQGVRLAHVELGSTVLVIGLGLLGLIAVGLLRSQGCRVAGVDIDTTKFDLARAFGADDTVTPTEADRLARLAGPFGFDAVIITAASRDNTSIEVAAEAVRTRGRVVAVGLIGLDVPREPFYHKEAELVVSHSLGIGRGDSRYEHSAEDYPIGQARWTVRRNIEAVVGAISSGALPVAQLTTHRFAVEGAARAYELVTRRSEPYLGVVLTYDGVAAQAPVRVISLRSAQHTSGALRVSLIGAGNFARLVLLPKLSVMRDISLRGICTAKGLTARETGDRYGFAYAASDVNDILKDPDTDAVLIATRHNLHAELAVAALRAGKHVLVEKPLCLDLDELDTIDRCVEELGARCPIVMVGFNRRFAVGMRRLKALFRDVHPLVLHYRFAVPELPPDSWVHDDTVGGGRLVGEACHAIDASCALVGSSPIRVFAECAAPSGHLARADDRVLITMRHVDGNLSSVSYVAGGDRSAPAERIEIVGGGRTAVLEGWERLTLWQGNRQKREKLPRDKGHEGALEAFVAAARTGGVWPVSWPDIRASALATLLAVRSIEEGQPFELGS